MSKHNENVSVNKYKDNNPAKKETFRWQMLTLLASIITISSLFGVWYANNEKAFLEIENKKLAVEAEGLKEEIKVLQNAIAQNENQAQDANPKPDETNTANQPDEKPPTENPPAEDNYEEYIVQPGDTLGGISVSLFGTESYISQIAELNGLNTESILQVGQKLKTPKKPGA